MQWHRTDRPEQVQPSSILCPSSGLHILQKQMTPSLCCPCKAMYHIHYNFTQFTGWSASHRMHRQPTEPDRKTPVVKSRALLSKQPCCSRTLLPPDQRSSTEIPHVQLPFLPTHHPPTATRAPPHRAKQQWSYSQCGCSSWKKGEPALRDQPALCHWHLVPSRAPVVREQSQNTGRRTLFLSLRRSPSLLTAGFPHSVFSLSICCY